MTLVGIALLAQIGWAIWFAAEGDGGAATTQAVFAILFGVFFAWQVGLRRGESRVSVLHMEGDLTASDLPGPP
jgi:hypothetical protein